MVSGTQVASLAMVYLSIEKFWKQLKLISVNFSHLIPEKNFNLFVWTLFLDIKLNCLFIISYYYFSVIAYVYLYLRNIQAYTVRIYISI